MSSISTAEGEDSVRRTDPFFLIYLDCFVARLPTVLDPSLIVDAHERLSAEMCLEFAPFEPEEAIIHQLAALPWERKQEFFWLFPWIAQKLFSPELADRAVEKFWEHNKRARQQRAEARRSKLSRHYVAP